MVGCAAWSLSGHMLDDRVKGKHDRGPLESRVAHLPLISSPKHNIKHSHWLWIRVRWSRWLFYQLEFPDIFDCLSSLKEMLTRRWCSAGRPSWDVQLRQKYKPSTIPLLSVWTLKGFIERVCLGSCNCGFGRTQIQIRVDSQLRSD